MKKVLFISHYFPPVGGAGVQRSTKFVKHLPASGWQPIVLTGEGKAGGRWTPEDRSLLGDIPPEAIVARVPAPPQGKLGAQQRFESYVRLGAELISQHRPDLILVTLSPFGDAAISATLAAEFNLPWIADLRDPWALDEFQIHRSRWHRTLERRRMVRQLRTASAIIMNTPEAAKKVRADLAGLETIPVTSITNGFAQEDFPVDNRRTGTNDRFTIVHSGSFHVEPGLAQRKRALEYRLLGRTEPGVKFLPRSHFYLLRAIEQFLTEVPSAAADLEVLCLGVATPADLELTQKSPAGSAFRMTGYLPHSESVEYVRTADLLFLPMHKMPKGARASIVPGKTYEYLASRRPILGAVPEGDCRDFLRRCGTAEICDPDNVGAMKAIIIKRYEEWKQRKPLPESDGSFVAKFERQNLTRQLASVLDQAVAHAAHSRAS